MTVRSSLPFYFIAIANRNWLIYKKKPIMQDESQLFANFKSISSVCVCVAGVGVRGRAAGEKAVSKRK